MSAPRSAREIAASSLLEAAASIAALCPPGYEASAVDISRRVGLMAAALRTHDGASVCDSCAKPFLFKKSSPQTRCYPCRTQGKHQTAMPGRSSTSP